MHSLKYLLNTIHFIIITFYKYFQYFTKRIIFNKMHSRECILTRMHSLKCILKIKNPNTGLMHLLVSPTCFSKSENQKLKSESTKFWFLTSALELRICKMHSS